MNYIVTYKEQGYRYFNLFKSLKNARKLRDEFKREKKKGLSIRDIYLAKIIK